MLFLKRLAIVLVLGLAGCPGDQIGVKGGYNKETGDITGEVDLTIPLKPKEVPAPAPDPKPPK